VDEEIERLKSLIDLGGYIPCPGHRRPPGCHWELIQYYTDRLKSLWRGAGFRCRDLKFSGKPELHKLDPGEGIDVVLVGSALDRSQAAGEAQEISREGAKVRRLWVFVEIQSGVLGIVVLIYDALYTGFERWCTEVDKKPQR
jgi:hypothetical protein